MEKIVYFKLMQIVLASAFIWHLLSLNEFCGTFADPKAFLHDISVGNCKSFTLIAKDSKTGEFGTVLDQDKWHNQFFMNSTNGQQQPTDEEHQCQLFDEFVTKLPSAECHCIPIKISLFYWFFDWIGMDRNLFNNDILYFFSIQFWYAFWSLVILCQVIEKVLRSVEEYEFSANLFAFHSVIYWSASAVISSNLLLYWTDFWTCVNFQADATNVPLATLVISIVMVGSSVFEIFFKNSMFKKRPVNASADVSEAQQQYELRNDIGTCAIE